MYLLVSAIPSSREHADGKRILELRHLLKASGAEGYVLRLAGCVLNGGTTH